MVAASLNTSNAVTVKFLCSYGGKILPRHPDGKLRYHGGHTRVLAFHRSVSFSELMPKLAEMCGSPVSLRCQLPTEDLDALVSVTSDEDLANLIEEYDRASSAASPPLKIRAFLYPLKSAARKRPASVTSPPSSASSSKSSSPRSPVPAKHPLPPLPPRAVVPICFERSAWKIPCYGNYGIYSIHNGSHWQ